MKPVPNVDVSIPVAPTVNCVTPEELAANISPEFVLFTISEAFDPIPPDIERGAGVEAEPTSTDVSESEASTMLPVPLGASVRLLFVVVPIVAGEPAPRLRVVDEIPSVVAEVIVARFAAVIVVALGRSNASLLIVTLPPVSPRLRVEAAPNALIVVAVVLNTSNEASAVTTLVVNVGVVPNTDTPVPVSSDSESIRN